MFPLSRRPLSRATSFEWCRKAQLNSKSAETHAAARALFLKGAIATESNTRGCGFAPALKFPFMAKIAFNNALLRILIWLPARARCERARRSATGRCRRPGIPLETVGHEVHVSIARQASRVALGCQLDRGSDRRRPSSPTGMTAVSELPALARYPVCLYVTRQWI